jgi:hypothetical protein
MDPKPVFVGMMVRLWFRSTDAVIRCQRHLFFLDSRAVCGKVLHWGSRVNPAEPVHTLLQPLQ